MHERDAEIDRLLAGGHLSGAQYDEIQKRVLDRVSPRTRGKWLWALPLGVVVAGAVLGVGTLRVAREQEGFRAKGSPSPSAVNLGCDRHMSRTCRYGSTLRFTVNSAVASGYLGAYAERIGGTHGSRIWYFPTATGSEPFVARGTGTFVVPDGIRIGSEHGPGRYRVTVWLSRRPLGRTEVDRVEAEQVVSRAQLEFVVEL